MENNLTAVASDYHRDGYYFPIEVMDARQTSKYRSQLEAVERTVGFQDPLISSIVFENANFVVPFIDEMARLPSVLEPVKAILGPDILVWGAGPLVKEPATVDYVSWHQDLTYWDLSDTAEVTAWIALSPATPDSGCMQFIAGTHTKEIVAHEDTFSDANMLSRGQQIAAKVDENDAVDVVLQPGQMSLHHGRMFHASHPNRSTERRIGMVMRYITPDMHQLSGIRTCASLVSGEDRFGHFDLLAPPTQLMAPEDIARGRQAVDAKNEFLYATSDQAGKRPTLN